MVGLVRTLATTTVVVGDCAQLRDGATYGATFAIATVPE